MTIRKLSLALGLLCASINASGTRVSYSGTVTSCGEGSEPLVGVTVTAKGLSAATSTDVDGRFTLTFEAPAGSQTLHFQYVGYEPQDVKVTAPGEPLQVCLTESSHALEEVVVIGYGAVKKSDLTGAVAVADAEGMKRMAATTVGQALQGQVPGVTVKKTGAPGAGASIYIRGISSLYSSTEPRWVIDGLPTSETRDFNPDDIESVQVLKDASAAAIYGSRAANGVIIVTTKKGKQGKTKIDLNVKYGWQKATKMYKLMDGPEWLALQDEKYFNAGQTGEPGSPTSYTNTYILDPTINHDWISEAFHTGSYQEYTVSASGASKVWNFMTSLDYFKNDGVFRGADFERITARINGGLEKGIFKLQESLLLSTSLANDAQSSMTDYARMTPLIPTYADDGSYALGGYNGSQTNGSNGVAKRDMSFSKCRSYRVQGTLTGELRFTPWLRYQINLGLDFDNYITTAGKEEGKWFPNQNPESKYSNSHHSDISTLLENLLVFHKQMGRNNLNVTVGYTEQRFRTSGIGGTVYDVNHTPGDLYYWTLANGSQPEVSESISKHALQSLLARAIYNFDDRYFLTVAFRRDGSSRFRKHRNYGNFYSFSGAWRISQEKFFAPVTPYVNNLKFKASYGVLGNEAIGNYKYSSHINSFVPYSYGSSQERIFGKIPSALVNKDLRWEKKYSTNIGLEAGLLNNRLTIEADYFINESRDLLAKVPMPFYLGSFGSLSDVGSDNPTMWSNVGKVRNQGVELNFGWKDYSHDIGYELNLNMYLLTNKIIKLGNDGAPIYGTNTKTTEGGILGQFFMLRTDGIYQVEDIYQTDADGRLLADPAGNPIMRTDLPTIYGNLPRPGDQRYVDACHTNPDGTVSKGANGVINDEDRVFVGSPWPKLEMNFHGLATWRGIDLSMDWGGAFNRGVYNTNSLIYNVGDNGNYIHGLKGWTPENRSQTTPKVYYSEPLRSNSTRFYQRHVSYWRLRNLQVGYTLPARFTRSVLIDRCRIYFSGDNLCTITNYKGIDPDFPGGGAFNTGVDGNSYPCVRTLSLGLQIGF